MKNPETDTETNIDIEIRVLNSQDSQKELELLMKDYLPFIKKQLQGYRNYGIDYEDLLSIAMLTFLNCVKQYRSGKGGFLPFAKTSIRNRLIDEFRKEARRPHSIPLKAEMDTDSPAAEEFAAFSDYSRKIQQENLNLEIDCFLKELSDYQITLKELSLKSPRQKRARILSLQIALAIKEDRSKSSLLSEKHQLPQKELAEQLNISVKTIEKHRKYIVALFILISGNYPCIRTFLPFNQEVKA